MELAKKEVREGGREGGRKGATAVTVGHERGVSYVELARLTK